jgi:DoxX-like family
MSHFARFRRPSIANGRKEAQMLIATDVLSGLLVFVFGGGAAGKLLGAKSQVQTAERLHIRWDRYRRIWILEGAAVLGLLAGFGAAPLGAVAAIGLVILMAGALVFRVRVHDSVAFLIGDGVILTLAAGTAALRIV